MYLEITRPGVHAPGPCNPSWWPELLAAQRDSLNQDAESTAHLNLRPKEGQMNEMKIECPHCKKPFELTEALASPLLEAERRKVTTEVERRLAVERDAAAQKASAATAA